MSNKQQTQHPLSPDPERIPEDVKDTQFFEDKEDFVLPPYEDDKDPDWDYGIDDEIFD